MDATTAAGRDIPVLETKWRHPYARYSSTMLRDHLADDAYASVVDAVEDCYAETAAVKEDQPVEAYTMRILINRVVPDYLDATGFDAPEAY